jgi:hypothetical protein
LAEIAADSLLGDSQDPGQVTIGIAREVAKNHRHPLPRWELGQNLDDVGTSRNIAWVDASRSVGAAQ